MISDDYPGPFIGETMRAALLAPPAATAEDRTETAHVAGSVASACLGGK